MSKKINTAEIILFPSCCLPHVNINELEIERRVRAELEIELRHNYGFFYKPHAEKLGIELAVILAKFYDEWKLCFHRYLLDNQPEGFHGQTDIWNALVLGYRTDAESWYQTSYDELVEYFGCDFFTKRRIILLTDKLVEKEILIRIPHSDNGISKIDKFYFRSVWE